MITFNLVVRLGLMTSRFDHYNIKIIKDLMTRIKMHIYKVKLPFYPPYEVKCGLQNRVSTSCSPEVKVMVVRTSNRLQRRPKMYRRTCMYYPSNVRKQKSRSKSKTSRTTVSEIYLAKKIHKRYLELLKLFIYFIYLFLLFL